MAIPFALPSEEEVEHQNQQHLEQLMLDLYTVLQQVLRQRNFQHPSRNHRIPRRTVDLSSSREHSMLLLDSDLSRLPLPDLVLSAVDQLPSVQLPQVTVSAPSSPTRDAAFQFPECSNNINSSNNLNNNIPIPSPRPKPRRRRLTSEGSITDKLKQSECCLGNKTCCKNHFVASLDEKEWQTVGANLRNIADDFHASKTKDAEIEKSRIPFLSYLNNNNGTNTTISTTTNTSSSRDNLLSLLIPAPLRETLWTTLALYLGWRLVSRLR